MTRSDGRPAAPGPNIVLVLADDMGFSDIGCYGGEIRTPNLDGLARRGLRFTQAYNCARCCPTRASLLTGLYPHQAGVGHMVNDRGVGPAYQGFLRADRPTIAEMLRPAGYRSLMSGKWHVGGSYVGRDSRSWRCLGDQRHPLPTRRGFERFWGMLGGAGSYFNTPYLACNESIVTPEGEAFYLTDAITDHAVSMIVEANAAPQRDPFFLYLAYTAPHWPLHALEEDIARYERAYRCGWDELRGRRREKLTAEGILDPRWPTSPRDAKAPAWADLPAARRDWEDLRMAVYAAQVDRMDQGIGRVLAALERTGAADNTLVMFLSDNGGCAEFLAEDSARPEPMRYDYPTRDGRPMRIGNIPGLRPGPADTFMSYDLPWANASNTPFRLYKSWVHEGGISTPLIVAPASSKPTAGGPWASGTLCHSPVHVVDLAPTIVDLAGAKATGPVPLEGESFLPAVQGQTWRRRRPIFWEHEGNRAVRDGDMKLVSRYPGRWELHDLAADRTELSDLAEEDPAGVKRLSGQYDDWAARCDVADWQQLKK
jgi:arylsulfatase